MGIKVGTLHENGKVDDLGVVDPEKGTFSPGEDSKKRVEACGWHTIFDSDDSYLAVPAQPESTGEMKCIFAVRSDCLSGCGGDDAVRRRFYAEEAVESLRGTYFDTDNACIRALLQAPEKEQLVLEWLDEPDLVIPTDEQVLDWAKDMLCEKDDFLFVTELLVVPVSMPEHLMEQRFRSSVGDESWQEQKNQYKECGDWRELAWDLVSYGSYVCVGSWSSYGEDFPVDGDILQAKMAATQVQMLLGFYLDRTVNAMGETGWDRLRDAGVIFAGDEVIDTRDNRVYTVEEVEGEKVQVTDEDDREMELPLGVIKTMDIWERMRRAKDQLSEKQDDPKGTA